MYLIFKRIFDIFVSVPGMAAMLAAAVFIKVAYMATGDFHTVFYRQTRIGKDGKPFKMLKFRSMIYGADNMMEEILSNVERRVEWEENQKLENDPRITKVGKVLRKTSLDELPQFINVFIGNMSLVGPRPLVAGELERHRGSAAKYGRMKPGITGWWACNGRSDTTYEERLALEYFYIENSSVKLDFRCMIKTISAIIRKAGSK